MKKIKAIRINIVFIFIIVFIFLCLIFKLVYIGTGRVKVKDESLSSFAARRDTVKKTIVARRGTIYSNKGQVLAKDVNSYTVIAYLEKSRTTDSNNPKHVVDKEKTAELLSPIINMSKERILEILNTTYKSCDDDGNNCEKKTPYQVELGPGGRGITELVKSQIEDLDLPGIDFISSSKRYYPNGDFLSYTLGYARTNDDGEYVGEMGLESYYNDELTGTNGYLEYQCDLYGYQITNTPSIEKKAVAGNDIYLTIDTNVQMFAEQAMAIVEEGKPEWASLSIMNAKTGEILGIASTPSFNNNTLEIKSYYDPFVSNTYEPGSTLKIFSFMAAMENGIYDGSAKYKSGKLKVDDATIKDWNTYGWGEITYDEGFMASSNVAASKLALALGRSKLMDFYTKLGFGQKTGISLPNESSGVVNFRYNTEVAAASYGQGMTVTAVQMLQALSAVANEGTMIKPYLVSKIVDSNTNEVLVENKREEVAKVCSKETSEALIKLMRGVVDGKSKYGTGSAYNVKGYDLVGKTGTAQIAGNGGYMTGSTNYVKSFAGMFPGSDPQIIVYIVASKVSSTTYLNKAIKSVVKNVGTYMNIKGTTTTESDEIFEVESYINKDIDTVKSNLDENNMQSVIIGNGDRVVDQYPKDGTSTNYSSKIFILTNSTSNTMPDITGWSRSDVMNYCNLVGLNVSFTGYGYVTKYSIEKDTVIKKGDTLEITLDTLYDESTDKDKKSTK